MEGALLAMAQVPQSWEEEEPVLSETWGRVGRPGTQGRDAERFVDQVTKESAGRTKALCSQLAVRG